MESHPLAMLPDFVGCKVSNLDLQKLRGLLGTSKKTHDAHACGFKIQRNDLANI